MYLSEEIGVIPNMDMETERGTYPRVEAEIDLGAIRDNFAAMRGRLRDDTKMIAVVKTDAYGHGAVRIAEMMEPEAYIWGFAVATTEEAVELRRAGIRKPILCLGFVFPQDYDLLVRLQIRPATFKLSMARQLSEAASRAGMILPVHLAVDTGMGRIGFQVCEEDADEAAEIAKLSNLKVEGLFTHFARADERDKGYTQEQFRKYCRFEQMLEERGVSIPLRHAANSASIMELPGTHLDAVRAGITIYGIYPSDEVDRNLMPMPDRDNPGRVRRRISEKPFKQGQCPDPWQARSHCRTDLHGPVHGGGDRDRGGGVRQGDAPRTGRERRGDGR